MTFSSKVNYSVDIILLENAFDFSTVTDINLFKEITLF